jgi:hypothetical protein
MNLITRFFVINLTVELLLTHIFFVIELNKYCFLTFNSNLHMVMHFPFWRMLTGTIFNYIQRSKYD